MSLINEALKRTRDASYQTGATPNYQINNTSETTAFGAKGTVVLTIAVIVIALGTVGIVALRRVAPVRTVHEALSSSAPETTPSSPVTKRVLITPNVLPAIETPAPAPPVAPKLTLQGITIDGAVREAMINGYNLREGEEINGARIVSIENRRVILQFDGREVLLRMP